MTPIEHYETTISSYNTINEKNEFTLKVALILKQYVEEDAKPKLKKCISGAKWSSFVKTNDTTAIDAVADRYYQACGLNDAEKRFLLTNNVSTSQVVDTTAPIVFETTQCCDDPEIVLLSEYAVCSTCGRKVNESNQYSANYTDASISPNKTVSVGGSGASSAEKSKLLLDPISRIQGLKTSTFTAKEWTKIYDEVTLGINKDELKDISHAQVDRVLHQLKMSKFYPDSPIIWETITGRRLQPLPDSVLWVIQNVMSPKLSVGTLIPTKDGHVVEDKRRSFGRAFLYKSLEVLDCHEYLHLVIIQKGNETLHKLNTLWEKYCQQSGWKFHPSS